MGKTTVEIAGVPLRNPITTASGTFGSGMEYGDFVDLSRLGAITTKGVAAEPWEGNATPRIAETPSGMLNAIGLQNAGIEAPYLLMGHSLGGATSVEVGRERDDIDAVVDIDGTMFGEEIDYQDGQVVYEEEPYPVPVLEFSNERGHNELMELKEGERYANAEMMGRALDSHYVWIRGTEHMDFTDLPMFSPMLGSMFGSGERDTEECMNITNSLILQFYDYYLKGKGELDFQEVY